MICHTLVMASGSPTLAHKRPPRTDADGNLTRLTANQFDLLSWIFVEMHLGNLEDKPLGVPVVWSPKTYLGRSPTNAEASTLSKRLGILVGYRLVIQRKRLLTVTGRGIKLLKLQNDRLDPANVNVLLALLLRFDELIRDHNAQRRLKKSLSAYREYLGEGEQEHSEIEHGLELLGAAIKRKIIELQKDVPNARNVPGK